jgi:deoxyribonuclease V
MNRIEEAKKAQLIMAGQVIQEDQLPTIGTIGGMDVSNNLYDPEQMIYASTVVLSYPNLEIIEQAVVQQKQSFPYIPGLLGFREAPALVETYKKLQKKPNILMVDGHGISHPRGLGIASHIGVLLDIPTIGVAKSILVGQPAAPLGPEAGAQVPLVWKDKTLGVLLKTKARSNPLIISVGHKISLSTAVELVKRCLRGYRLPEVTRQAHLAANSCRRGLIN